jgi:hypothetical protein
MSRTDHHMPHWVTAVWYEPVHHRCVAGRRWSDRYRDRLPCDLPDRPVRHHPVLSHWRATAGTRCTWEPDWDGVRSYPRPPRWYVEHVWHNPERVRVRDTLHAAAAEYRATGDTDLEPDPRQARHSAEWMWA